jgi:hypothetical protein
MPVVPSLSLTRIVMPHLGKTKRKHYPISLKLMIARAYGSTETLVYYLGTFDAFSCCSSLNLKSSNFKSLW